MKKLIISIAGVAAVAGIATIIVGIIHKYKNK